MYGIYIDDKNLNAYGFLCIKRPDIPAPERRIKKIIIPGRDGSLYIDEETYEDITFSIELNYMETEEKWHEKFRKLKGLFKNAKELRFSDDKGYFRKIKKIDIGTNKRTSNRIGVLSPTFTIDPYYFLESGKTLFKNITSITNDYDVSMPIYKITGEGMCTLKINDKSMIANVGQNLIIDTDLKLSYREDGTTQNTNVSGSYDDLYLVEGVNNIEITSGFDLEIIPNWRVQ